MRERVAQNDVIQVNEDGPAHWFRCILVVDEVIKDWGVSAYCITPDSDFCVHLAWDEFDTLGVKSKFVATKLPEPSYDRA